MNADIRYNSEGEPTTIKVDASPEFHATARFSVDDKNAHLQSITPGKGTDGVVFGEVISVVMDYVVNLPMIQHVEIQKADPEIRERALEGIEA